MVASFAAGLSMMPHKQYSYQVSCLLGSMLFHSGCESFVEPRLTREQEIARRWIHAEDRYNFSKDLHNFSNDCTESCDARWLSCLADAKEQQRGLRLVSKVKCVKKEDECRKGCNAPPKDPHRAVRF
jgi:hypothetical protein